MVYDVYFTIHTGIVILALHVAFVLVLNQHRAEFVGSQQSRVSVEIRTHMIDVREEFLRFLTDPLRSPYDRRTILVPKSS